MFALGTRGSVRLVLVIFLFGVFYAGRYYLLQGTMYAYGGTKRFLLYPDHATESWEPIMMEDAYRLPCQDTNDLGDVNADTTEMDLKTVERKFPELQNGGLYAPKCVAENKIAVIIPYRDREAHLAIFLNHIHPFLMKQQLEYGIFVIEQNGDSAFNRASLMNVGFLESETLHDHKWDCYIFHDIDLLPTNTKNIYNCSSQPKHMSVAIDVFKYKLPYATIFGGVTAFTPEQFHEVNGFSNQYWGWGGEDDDLYRRVKRVKWNIERPSAAVARYVMLSHKKAKPNPQRFSLLKKTSTQMSSDGLTTLKYTRTTLDKHRLFTHVKVNLDDMKDIEDAAKVAPIVSVTSPVTNKTEPTTIKQNTTQL